MNCELCDDACTDANLEPLLDTRLSWLWEKVAAAANRRGDERLTTGTLSIQAPNGADERSAVTGLLGGHLLKPAQTRSIDLADLTTRIRGRGSNLTPGAVAAHATGHRLAVKAQQKKDQSAASARLRTHLQTSLAALPEHVRERIGDDVFARLERAGWVKRILNTSNPMALLENACKVLARLPDPHEHVDRRTLVPGDPHALDEGVLPSLVLALTAVNRMPARAAWASLGVDFDDLLGGLIVTGLTPRGWIVPAGATLTIPPRELIDVTWTPPPAPGTWAFVTENPSVLAAAASLAPIMAGDGSTGPYVLCTAGTPSALETQAIAALQIAGWSVAARADFDAAGLAHMRAILQAAPNTTPWRMSTADYLQVNPDGELLLALADDAAPWDQDLVANMRQAGAKVYEEDLLELLLADVQAGYPNSAPR